MADTYGGIQIYSTRVPMGGWRGAMLLAFAVAILFALPVARQLIAVGLVGGAGVGLALIVLRSRLQPCRTVAGGLLQLMS